jgi:hypothetical protein
MFRKRNITRAVVTLVLVLSAALTGAASAEGDPTLSAPGGCALQCIEKAL